MVDPKGVGPNERAARRKSIFAFASSPS